MTGQTGVSGRCWIGARRSGWAMRMAGVAPVLSSILPLVWASVLAVGLASCGSSSPPARACTPGQSTACGCTNGAIGAQVCRVDGSGLAPCVCGSGGAGSGGSNGAGTGGGGASGAGSGGATATGGAVPSGGSGGDRSGRDGRSRYGRLRRDDRRRRRGRFRRQCRVGRQWWRFWQRRFGRCRQWR
jgi:hypothetical protein